MTNLKINRRNAITGILGVGIGLCLPKLTETPIKVGDWVKSKLIAKDMKNPARNFDMGKFEVHEIKKLLFNEEAQKLYSRYYPEIDWTKEQLAIVSNLENVTPIEEFYNSLEYSMPMIDLERV